jgi:hypothetical protein
MIKYLYDSFIALDNINKAMVVIMIGLLTFTVVITILDYRNNGKHIDKKRW